MSSSPLHALVARSLKAKEYRNATVYALRLATLGPNAETLAPLFEVVQKHAAALRAADHHDEASERLAWLETWLGGQATVVPLDDVATVLGWADTVGAEARQAPPVPDLRDPKLDSAIGIALRWEARTLPARGKAGKRLEEVEELREYAVRVVGEKPTGKLVVALEEEAQALRVSQAFDQAFDEARAGLEKVKGQPPEYAAYTLQAVEQVLRPIAGFRAELDPERRQDADKVLDELRKRSEQVAQAARETEAVAAWGEFYERHSKRVATILAWGPEPRPKRGGGHCKAQLDRISLLGRDLAEELHKFSGKPIKDARKLGETLQKRAGDAGIAQHRAYNSWAMASVQSAFEAGDQHVSLLLPHEKEKLALVLFEQLAPIDTRFLTSEASRAYSEVFEYLFAKLAGPKNAEDFKTDGRKLNALARMFEVDKVDLGAF